jgi:Arc/MetJ family transcription regulator
MRATIVIDDRLMARAMRASGAATKREAVERGLELLLALGGQSLIQGYEREVGRQAQIRRHRGRLQMGR